MAFPRRYLNDGEEVILDLRPHWAFLAGPAVMLVAGLALAVWLRDRSEWVLFPALGLAVVALLVFLVRYARA